MDTYININKIISITIADKREYIKPPDYVKVYSKGEPKYKINFTILFWDFHYFKSKEVYEEDVFCPRFDDTEYTRSELNKKFKDDDLLFIQDGILYEKPYLEICLENDKKVCKYFDRIEECYLYLIRKGITKYSLPIVRI